MSSINPATAVAVAVALVVCLMPWTVAADTCGYQDYDLSPFNNNGEGYSVKDDEYEYYLSVCSSLTQSVCGTDVTVCQTWASGSKTLAGTSAAYAALSPSGSGVSMTLDGGAPSTTCGKDNSAVFNFRCDMSIKTKTYDWTFVSSKDCVTTFAVSHCAACPGGCGDSPSSPSPPPPGGHSGPPSPPSPPGHHDSGGAKDSHAGAIGISLGVIFIVMGLMGFALGVFAWRRMRDVEREGHAMLDYGRLTSSGDDQGSAFGGQGSSDSLAPYGTLNGPGATPFDTADAAAAAWEAASRSSDDMDPFGEGGPSPAEIEAAAGKPSTNGVISVLRCKACARMNEVDALFCKQCGAHLDSGKKPKYRMMDTSVMSRFDRYGRELPKYWRMSTDGRGRPFYYNKKTHERTSKRPKTTSSSSRRS